MDCQQHNSVLGSWRIYNCQPDPRLQPIVSALWYGEGRMLYQRDRILPSAQSQLLINLGPTQYRIDPGPPERRIPFDDIWYMGLQQQSIDAEAPHGNALLGVAFHAQGTYRWLGDALAEGGGAVLPLADLLGARELGLREQLLNTPDIGQRFAIVQHWLLQRMNALSPVHPAVLQSIDLLQRSAGRCAIGELVRQTGFSRKHLAALFKRQVGLSPKALARVLRFRQVVKLLQSRDPGSCFDLADSFGFYDQSHLINEIRAFSGFSPQELLKQRQPDSSSIVLR